MGLDILSADTGRTHGLGAPPTISYVRSFVVKFVWYNNRRKIYTKKNKLKWSKLSISKSLTAQSVSKLKEAREKFCFKNFWSGDGYYKDKGDYQASN